MTDESQEPFSPALAQFLTNRLAEVIATASYARQGWTLARIADHITQSEAIEGTLSATTLGRMLDPGHRQQPGAATVRMVRKFLLHHRYITCQQLDWVEASLAIRSGLSLAAFYDVPDTRHQRAFLQSLDGEYRTTRIEEPYRLESRLHLNFLPRAGLLCATEVLTLMRRSGSASTPHERIAQYVATGQALASADLICIFLKEDRHALHTVLNVRALVYDDDVPTILKTLRNSGWRGLSRGELDVPPPRDVSTPPRQMVRSLASDPQYSRPDPAEKLAGDTSDTRQSAQNAKDFIDLRTMWGDMTASNLKQQWDAASTDERMMLAWDHHQLAMFTDALRAGADPNLVPDGEGLSLVHRAARGGSLAWTRALLDDPRCRLTPDAQGLPPSFHVGVMIRSLAGAQGADDLIDEWSALYRLLLAREQEQGCVMQIADPG